MWEDILLAQLLASTWVVLLNYFFGKGTIVAVAAIQARQKDNVRCQSSVAKEKYSLQSSNGMFENPTAENQKRQRSTTPCGVHRGAAL